MSSGFANILKPAGMTSHDVVSRVRRILKTRAVGHMGTLDPEAAGVLPLAIGKATRLIPFIEGESKAYRAQVVFGIATDTADTHGVITHSQVPSSVSREDLLSVLPRFKGEIMQIPPMYSAVKVKGKKLYELARAGLEIEREPRPITVKDIDMIQFESLSNGLAVATIDVTCSRGTYIRTLCHDMGLALNTHACMGFLLRTQSGPFTLEGSVTLPELEQSPVLLAPDSLFAPERQVTLSMEEARRFVHGQQLVCEGNAGVVALSTKGVFLGVGRLEKSLLSPLRVLAQEEDLRS